MCRPFCLRIVVINESEFAHKKSNELEKGEVVIERVNLRIRRLREDGRLM